MAIIFKHFRHGLLGLSFLFSSCTSLMYWPDKNFYAHPERFKTSFEPFDLPSLDGTKLTAWRLLSKKKPPQNLVLFFHGNAQNLTSHFVNLVWLTEHGFDVIIFDYRGYGLSEGKPSPEGLALDGLSFLNYAYEEYQKGKFKRLIVYTQSLGGAVALKSLEEFKHREAIALLVLDSTFLLPRDVAREKTNRVFATIIPNDFTAHPALLHLTMPVLSIHSTGDRVIPYKLGRELYDKITSSPQKDFWQVDVPGHGDVFYIDDLKFRQRFLNYVNAL